MRTHALRYPALILATAIFSLPTFWVLVTSMKKQSEFAGLRLFYGFMAAHPGLRSTWYSTSARPSARKP